MSNCMDKYKNDFAIKFARLMEKELPLWKKTQKEGRYSLCNGTWLGVYFISFAFAFIPGKHETGYNLEMHFWMGVIFCIASIIGAIVVENKYYQNTIKKRLFPKLLKVFTERISYPGVIITNPEYQNSDLLKMPLNSRDTDDKFSGEYKEVPFKIEETTLSYKTYDKRGRLDKYIELFKGVALHFLMKKDIKSRVLIYSKSLFKKPPKNYEKVTLEYEKFNKKYNVYVKKDQNSEGQIEARYLFNTAFLERFMQIQTSFRVRKMECSICGNELLFLLHTRKDLFEMNHLFGKVDDIHQYRRLFDEFASVLSFIDVLNLSSKTKL